MIILKTGLVTTVNRRREVRQKGKKCAFTGLLLKCLLGYFGIAHFGNFLRKVIAQSNLSISFNKPSFCSLAKNIVNVFEVPLKRS